MARPFGDRISAAALSLALSLALAACGDNGGQSDVASAAVAPTGTTDPTGASATNIPSAPGTADTPSAPETSQTVTGSLPSSTGSAGTTGNSPTNTATSTSTGTNSSAASSSASGTSGKSTSATSTPATSTSLAASSSSASSATVTNNIIASGEAMVSWLPPSENTDGSSLTDLTGFNIYYGKDPANLDNMLTLDCYWCLWTKVTNLGSGTWYFAVKSYNKTGIESAFSRIMSKTIS